MDGNEMTCTQLREQFPNECPQCCGMCHEDADMGYNHDLDMGFEPCCNLKIFAQSKGLEPYD